MNSRALKHSSPGQSICQPVLGHCERVKIPDETWFLQRTAPVPSGIVEAKSRHAGASGRQPATDGVELNGRNRHQGLGVLEVIRYRPRSLQGQDNGLPNQRSVAVSSAVPGDIGKRRALPTSP